MTVRKILAKPRILAGLAFAFIAACSSEYCPEYDVRPIGAVDGQELYEIHIKTHRSQDLTVTAADEAAILDSRVCSGGFQEIQISSEINELNQETKIITFYCL